jgi:hypothetical protein
MSSTRADRRQKRTLARRPCAVDAGAREVRLDRSVTSNLWPEPPLVQGAFRLAPLSGELVDLDTRAYLESPVAITAHSAGRWPVEGFTHEENLRLIEGHEREHAAGEAFTYALLSPGRDQEWGCVYLRPLQFFLDGSGTKLALDPSVISDAAIVTLWLIDDTANRPAPEEVVASLEAWLRAWRPHAAIFRCLPAETEILDALTEAGLSQIKATQQELPFLWFVRR